ncbi:DUF4097 family beta strand repeat-containing protein, partial [Streptomyces varsoviensis]|uniref:DUF4097 domain-containing protein n=1 Tax=Streptomyces varsoviensis TaxID=67373 RepID=A0ABR5J451_9ACTN
MPAPSEWSLDAPRKLTFENPVTTLHVRLVGGTVNVVGSDSGPARLELSAIEGPPLTVTHDGGDLTVTYDDLTWKYFLKWFTPTGGRRTAHVTLTVPTSTRVEVGVVEAGAVVSGVSGRTDVRGVSGDTTLVGLTGEVRADTVSGRLEAQALTGDLRFNSVNGDLTLIESGSGAVKAESVSGDMVVDLSPGAKSSRIDLTTVSGEVAIRLPHAADAEVEANTASGALSNAFDDLRVSSQWGAKRVTGQLGAGSGKLKVTTVSGSVALLRRPRSEAGADDTADAGGTAANATERKDL